MASDFDLTGRVRIDTRDIDALAERVGGSFRSMAGVAAGAIAGIGLAGLGKSAISVAADFQQTSISFKTMLGSGEKAQAFLGKLKDFAKATPFEFPELATAASSLISVGINADKVVPIMRSLGNATAGMGTGQEGIKRATIALQQMNAAGRITGEDLNQLRDAGIPVYDLLAAATGKSKEKVTELAQAGKLGKKELEQLMAALESGKGLERFNGLMEAQSLTLNGVISSLKDTLSGIAIDFITPYLPGMAKQLQGFTDFISTTVVPAMHVAVDAFTLGFASADTKVAPGMSRMQEIFLRLGGVVREVVTHVRDGVGTMVSAFETGGDAVTRSGFAGAMERIGQVARQVFDAIKGGGGFDGIIAALQSGGSDAGGGLAKTIGDFAGSIKDVTDAAPSLTDVLKIAGEVVKFLADHIDLLVKAMPYVIAGFALFKTAQAAANTAALLTIPVTIAQTASNFALAASLRAAGAAATTGAGEQAAAGVVARTGMFATIGTMATTVASVVGGWVVMGAQAMLNAAKTAGAWALSTGASMAGAIASMAVSVASVVGGWILMGVQSLLGAARVAAAWLIAMGPIGLVIAAVAGVTVLIVKNWDTIKEKTSAAWDAVVGFVSGAWTRVKEAVTGGVKNAIEAAKGLISGIKEGIGGIAGDMGEIAVNLVDGLINGISKLGGKLKEFVKNWAKDNIPGPIADALGISSPSKVAIELGKQVPAGFSIGIDKGTARVRSSLDNMLAIPTVGTSGVGAGAALGTGGGVSIGNITINGASNPNDPAWSSELTAAIAAGVGRR